MTFLVRRRCAFWRDEVPLRLRSWWRRHWWPARIRQLDRERRYWKAVVQRPDDPPPARIESDDSWLDEQAFS